MKTIIACIDFSPVTEDVVNIASNLAGALGDKLYIVHVSTLIPLAGGFEAFTPMVDETAGERLRLAREQLDELCGRLKARGVDATGLLTEGLPTDQVLAQAANLKADLIVMGSHGRGALFHLLTGSTAHGVLRKASCSVVIVPSLKSSEITASVLKNRAKIAQTS